MLLQVSHYYNIVLVVHIGAKHWNLFKIQIHFFIYKSTNTFSARIYLNNKKKSNIPNKQIKKHGNFGIDNPKLTLYGQILQLLDHCAVVCVGKLIDFNINLSYIQI